MAHEELSRDHDDPLIRFLHHVIRFSIKVLGVLMVAVILWGVADVIYVIFTNVMSPPRFLLDVGDIFQIFGAFMVVLIAVEIFTNIRLYLGTDELPLRLVIATALMAIARKVIVLDLEEIDALYVLAISSVVLSLGVTYWLISKNRPTAVDRL
jgi:uncharacterized membrane protein (DUF373 family)